MMKRMLPASTLHSQTLLEAGSEMMKTSPATNTGVSDLTAWALPGYREDTPMQGGVVEGLQGGVGLLPDYSS